MMRALLAAAALMASAGAGQAVVYKCSIEDGVDGSDGRLVGIVANGSVHLNTSFIIDIEKGLVQGKIASPFRPPWKVARRGDTKEWDWEFVRVDTDNTHELIRLRLWDDRNGGDRRPRFSYYTLGELFTGRCEEVR